MIELRNLNSLKFNKANYIQVFQIGNKMQYLQSLVSVELDLEKIKRESIKL